MINQYVIGCHLHGCGTQDALPFFGKTSHAQAGASREDHNLFRRRPLLVRCLSYSEKNSSRSQNYTIGSSLEFVGDVWLIEKTVQVPSENRLNSMLNKNLQDMLHWVPFGYTKTYRCRGSWPIRLANGLTKRDSKKDWRKLSRLQHLKREQAGVKIKSRYPNLMSSQLSVTMATHCSEHKIHQKG